MNPSPIPTEDAMLTWSAPEHSHQKRTAVWYVLAALFIAMCVGYSIYTEAWTFTILIVVLTVVYWKMHAQEVAPREIRMWRSGFAMDKAYSEWGECEGYWILKGPDYYELHIEKKNGSEYKIQTGDINPYLLHDLMPNLLPQLENRREKVLDTIIRICKL